MTEKPPAIKVGTPVLTHTHGYLQVRSVYWTSTEPKEPMVALGEPGGSATVMAVSLRYARRLMNLGARHAAAR
jgi:hypothetical protein